VGARRWLPPQPVEAWSGVRPAHQYGAISAQSVMALNAPGAPDFSHQPQSEDCLFLNVWTPGLDDARRPVMFWIHGGGFTMGAGSEAFMEGGKLAKRGDIVLVSINYRLGPPGFLNLKEITGGKIPSTGNEGMLDQVAALDWVMANIAAFGGNPDNITIFGFSAGGMSVGTLLALKAARGKFHKAMNRSGAANAVCTLESAVKITEQYLGILGLKGHDVDGLRKLTTQQLMDGQQKLGVILRQTTGRAIPFQPVVDGMVMDKTPMEAIRQGSAKNIPIVAGNTLDEMKMMSTMDPTLKNLDDAGLSARLKQLVPAAKVAGLISAYRAALQKRGRTTTPAEILSTINTDLVFRIPTIALVEAQRDQGAAAYNYLFTYPSPALNGAVGAQHGIDNPLLFGNPDPAFTGAGPQIDNLMYKIMDSAAAFARSGNPSCPTIGQWPVYGKDRSTMVFDLNTRLEKAPFEMERAAWGTGEGVNID
jgi:para-nitrobenzyl esterase